MSGSTVMRKPLTSWYLMNKGHACKHNLLGDGGSGAGGGVLWVGSLGKIVSESGTVIKVGVVSQRGVWVWWE